MATCEASPSLERIENSTGRGLLSKGIPLWFLVRKSLAPSLCAMPGLIIREHWTYTIRRAYRLCLSGLMSGSYRRRGRSLFLRCMGFRPLTPHTTPTLSDTPLPDEKCSPDGQAAGRGDAGRAPGAGLPKPPLRWCCKKGLYPRPASKRR